jgi:hypothetical protein
MGHTVKSARGVKVDFDLLKIKEQIAAAPKTTDVKARESFIDQKFKRRLKKLTQDIVTRTEPEITPTTEDQLPPDEEVQ